MGIEKRKYKPGITKFPSWQDLGGLVLTLDPTRKRSQILIFFPAFIASALGFVFTIQILLKIRMSCMLHALIWPTYLSLFFSKVVIVWTKHLVIMQSKQGSRFWRSILCFQIYSLTCQEKNSVIVVCCLSKHLFFSFSSYKTNYFVLNLT